MKLVYYKNLDGIRGIAALMVLIFHFFSYPNTDYLENLTFYQKVTEFGQHGVSLFFVLSGFVITRILIHTRESKGYFKIFYWRRILRIFPLYYLFLFFYYLLIPYLTDSVRIDLPNKLPFFFYLQNLTTLLNIKALGPGHFWSLAVEEHFYLLWPMFVFFIKPKYLIYFIVFVIILVFILKYYMLLNGLSINKFTFTRIDQILLGGIIAVLELRSSSSGINLKKIFCIIGIIVVPIAIFIYLGSDLFPMLKEMSKYFLLGLIFFSLIGWLIFSSNDNFVNKILTRPLLQYLGRISYGIYVWHILALALLNKFLIFQVAIIDMFFTIILTIFMAHISYYYFESFFLILKDKRFTYKDINGLFKLKFYK